MTQRAYLALVAVLAGVLVFLGLNAPLSEGLSIGGDDVFELGKAQLLARQPEMAERLHNDQPWLLTLAVAQAFRLLGENAAIPRLFSLGFTLALVLACWHVMGKGCSMLEGALFLCVLFTSREVPTLVTSAMLEPAAMALGVLAVACSYSWRQPVTPWRAYVSGLLLAAAVSTKLTSLLVIPAWFTLLWLQRKSTPLASVLYRAAFGFVAGMLWVSSISPTFSFESLWLSHWRAHQAIAQQPQGYGFRIEDVFHEWTILLAVLLGVLKLLVRRSPAEHGIVFALVWLGTALAVHVWHKPWWGYYALHFHVPLAIVAAQGAGWVIRRAWQDIAWKPAPDTSPGPLDGRFRWPLPQDVSAGVAAVVATTVVACWCGIRLPLFWKEAAEIQARETAAHNTFISVIRQYAPRAHWIYCNPNRVAFHGGVLQPPGLVIMTYKRLVTGDLNRDRIYSILRSYQPDLLLLQRNGELQDKRFVNWLAQEKYVRALWAGDAELWVARRLNPSEAQSPEALVKSLRL